MRPPSISSQWSGRKRTAGESTSPQAGVGAEIEQVAADGDARPRVVGAARQWNSRQGRGGMRIACIPSDATHRAMSRAARSASSTAAPSSRSTTRRRRAPCSTGCARTRAAPAPRKAAPKATAAPARSSSASSPTRRATRRRLQARVNACIQFAADARRQGAVHRRGPAGSRTARCIRCSRRWSTATARNAASARPGFVMSLWAIYRAPRRARHAADAPAARRRAVGQPLPLHRLPADPRCRRAHVRPAGGAARRRSRVRRRARADRARRHASTTQRRAASAELLAPRTLDDFAAAARGASRRRASSPAPPTSACGSPSSSATSATSSTSATSTS